MAAIIVVAKGAEVGGQALADTRFGQRRSAQGVQGVGEWANIYPAPGGVVPPAATAGSGTAPPVETAPVETAPAATAPVETAPAETGPAETAPVETAPVDGTRPTAPARPPRPRPPRPRPPPPTAPAETAPAETAPAEAAPVEPHVRLGGGVRAAQPVGGDRGRGRRPGRAIEEGAPAEGEPGFQENPLDLPENQVSMESAEAAHNSLPRAERRQDDGAGRGRGDLRERMGRQPRVAEGKAATTEQVLSEGVEAGVEHDPHVFDPKNVEGSLELGAPSARRPSTTRTSRSASSRDMCAGCQRWFQARAMSRGVPQFVADPSGGRVFMPDGRIIPR